MSAFLVEPCVSVPGSSEAETFVRQIFYQHWKKMAEQLQATARSIENWRQATTEQIKKYADDQMRILGEDYDRQRLVLDRKCEESLDLMRSCCSNETIDLFHDMQNTWRAIEFQVAQLGNVRGTLEGPMVITVHQQVEKANHRDASVLQQEFLQLGEQHVVHSQNNQSVVTPVSDNSPVPIPNEAQ